MTKVFISYSWDGPEHREWVRHLACRFRDELHCDVLLDQWSLAPGEDLTAFMERAVRESDRVVLVCTEPYKLRADDRSGGGGYETAVITGEIQTGTSRKKFVPVLRGGDWRGSAPSYLAGTFYIDLRGDPYPADQYEILAGALLADGPKPAPKALPSPPPATLLPGLSLPMKIAAVLVGLALLIIPRAVDNPQFQLSPDEVRLAAGAYRTRLLALGVAAVALMSSASFFWTRRRGSRVWQVRAFTLALLAGWGLFVGNLNVGALQRSGTVDPTLPKLAWPLNAAIALGGLAVCAHLWSFFVEKGGPPR
jgi:hypothetical protein